VTTAIDSNVLIALWDVDDALNREAQAALDQALAHGKLVVPAPVFAELLAFPQRTEGFLQAFFGDWYRCWLGTFGKCLEGGRTGSRSLRGAAEAEW